METDIPKYRKKRTKKPFAIERKGWHDGKWWVCGRYATEHDMRQALKALQGTTFFGCKFEYRVKGEE